MRILPSEGKMRMRYKKPFRSPQATVLKSQHAQLNATIAPTEKKQWGQYIRTCCGCAANSPFGHVCVCLACAGAHAKHTQTCPTTCGRRRRPTCTGVLPLQK